MSFATLSTDEQLHRVSVALGELLGDHGNRHDYLALLQATHDYLDELEAIEATINAVQSHQSASTV